MSLSKEVQQALEKIGSVSITTLDKETMHSRIISICGSDEENIYFLTMVVKPFYRQLKENPNRVDGSRCDECGSCFQICPQEAVELSLTI
ncbi:hypothetical protein MTBBW1_1930008 [Desulfamplus magnetovallimortis]|uniref:4Fe-4S ferredoxin-type domain-containing protein n=1 Tax=Desulfamplus magnetovallimortis TaxID=1246637 RepID=A0A1W1HB13_9BACT|nr:4Fe-4S binding protein [Desulfamplus magnetovallimortis]SLM29670.1 hypothetical protein MTBBW1_1930008 [Desulfamplus magnetovallimortis]